MNSKYLFAQMNRKIFFTIFLPLLFAMQAFAQPGGGGGLEIGKLYDKNLKAIDLEDTSLKIRSFILDKGAIQEETFLNQRLVGRNVYYDSILGLCYPGIDADYRIYIIYKKDTMIVDFAGIIPSNGGGSVDHMDSLVIQNGYFKYCRRENGYNGYNPFYGYENYMNQICLVNGFTPFTIKQLVRTGCIYYDSRIDLSFIDEKNLSASYYLRNAEYYLRFDDAERALANINKAIEKSNGNKSCEIVYLLCDAYTKAGKYEDALDAILSAVDCRRYGLHGYPLPDEDTKIENYKIRIDLFLKLKQYENALRDYDSLYQISDNYDKISINVKRADFKTNYLKDYSGAITDLKETINQMFPYILCYKPRNWDTYGATYFSLARAEYLSGDKQSAFRHWLKAEELGYNSSVSYVIHFDSIINKNPTISELYLARALAYYKLGKGKDKAINDSLTRALKDIHTAETLGMNDYRINMYRASVLYEMKNYPEALKEIDQAIGKDNTVPECFLIRYRIREALKQTKWNDDTDVDLVRLRKLAQDWTWDKW